MHALCRLIACTLVWAACTVLMAQDVWTKSIRDVTPMPGSDVKEQLGAESKDLLLHIQRDEPGNNMTVDCVYHNLLQETSEMVSQLHHLLRADRHLFSPSKALAESGEKG